MLVVADARVIPLLNGCVDCVVTSPPYYGLRDYGSTRQIGCEPTADEFVVALVAVFAEVRRVLKDTGTVWINIGDSYDNAKNMVGIPWRVAFGLQASGWKLRCDIIWAKPNPKPESVADRPTQSHEYLFLFTKNSAYYYDADAIREPLSDYYTDEMTDVEHARPIGVDHFSKADRLAKGTTTALTRASRLGFVNPLGRNKRSVWTVAAMLYEGAHFATMPEALVEPCILAGSPIGGLVFDPFIGSGTVGAVAERTSRRWVGCDIGYQNLAKTRTAQLGLRF